MFKIKGNDGTNRISVSLSEHIFERLENLAKLYELTTSNVAAQCIDYALENIEMEKSVFSENYEKITNNNT